jgi:hypothetical protein
MVKILRIFQGIFVKTKPPVRRALPGFLKNNRAAVEPEVCLWFGVGEVKKG